MGHIHNRSPETSERLRKTLAALLAAGDQGITRAELRLASGGEAVNSDIAEIRRWAKETDAPYEIPAARCDGRAKSGAMIYRYFAYRRTAADPSGQMLLL